MKFVILQEKGEIDRELERKKDMDKKMLLRRKISFLRNFASATLTSHPILLLLFPACKATESLTLRKSNSQFLLL